MPAAGYRKGVSDRKVPLIAYARTRLPMSLHQQLANDAVRRGLTVAKLMRAIIEHHYRGRDVPRVKATGQAYALTRELNRLGVNLNQLTHLANATRLVPVPELHRLLARIEAVIGRI